jgi:hypothetical protein
MFVLTMRDILVWMNFLDRIEKYSINHNGDNGLTNIIDKIEKGESKNNPFSFESPLTTYMSFYRNNPELLPYPTVPHKEFVK